MTRYSLGLESGAVRVDPYNHEWPHLFGLEEKRLREFFARANLAVVIEHTGSTSIPGLAAKPVLDILAGYPPGESVQPYIHAMESAGYSHRGQQGIPGREFFRRGEPRSYHLHLTTIGSQFWKDHLAFRDRLRANAALRDQYAELKHNLAAQFPRNREAYINGKEAFVKSVLTYGAQQGADVHITGHGCKTSRDTG